MSCLIKLVQHKMKMCECIREYTSVGATLVVAQGRHNACPYIGNTCA